MEYVSFSSRTINISDITVTNDFFQFLGEVDGISVPSLRIYRAHIVSLKVNSDIISEYRQDGPKQYNCCKLCIATTCGITYVINVKFEKDKYGVNPENTFTGLIQKIFTLEHPSKPMITII